MPEAPPCSPGRWPLEPAGRLVLTSPDQPRQVFVLAKAGLGIGRSEANEIVVLDARASRLHARLDLGPTGWWLADLGSTNGTRVKGVRVERVLLQPGDVIEIGQSALRLEAGTPEALLGWAEPDLTAVDTEADLEATLTEEALPVTLAETRRPRLAIQLGERTWEVALPEGELTIGRQADNGLVLEDTKTSGHHARLEPTPQSYLLRDLGSTNRTWLGERAVDEHLLRPGDTFRIGQARLSFKVGFDPEALTVADEAPAPRHGPRWPVVIVPGFMGSELWAGSERVWPNVRRLFREPDLFRLPERIPLAPRGPVGEVVIVPNLVRLQQYNRLGDFLVEGLGYERGRDLFEFGYDWRRDVRLSARRLAEQVEAWGPQGPIHLIAHSMGCLVSRYYVERLGGRDRVGRLILLGGPHRGVPKAVVSLLVGPKLLPFGLLGERLREVIATFPSLYQILPTYACVVDEGGHTLDLLKDESWAGEAQRPDVRAAREFRRELGHRSSVPSVSIFGYGISTVTRVAIRQDPRGGWQDIRLASQVGGDATIPQGSAVLLGSEIHPVQQHHGTLYVDSDVKMRLKLELTG